MKKVFFTGLAAGIAMVVVNMVLNPIFYALFPGLKDAYMTSFFRPWNDPIMMLFFLYPIALGVGLSFVWDKTKNLFNKSCCQNGLKFGLIYFLVSGIPTFLINYSSFNLPFEMILSWTLMGFIDSLVAGFVLAAINK